MRASTRVNSIDVSAGNAGVPALRNLSYPASFAYVIRTWISVLMCVCFCAVAQAEDAVVPDPGTAEKETKVYLNPGEELLVTLQQYEKLLRRQIYREASVRAPERLGRYVRDRAAAQEVLRRLEKELDDMEHDKDVDAARLERVLNGVSEAQRVVAICTEGIAVVETAAEQMTKHRGLIERTLARTRVKLGAEANQCGLHREPLNLVRVPVIGETDAAAAYGPAAADSAIDITRRIRQFPCPAEPFVTSDAITDTTPKHLVAPACAICTRNHQAWVASRKTTPPKSQPSTPRNPQK